MDTNSRILGVSNLTVRFDDKLIFDNLNFELAERDTLVVLGPNGAGKTVLLRTLLGILPHRGRIEWRDGARIGYVPQRIPLNRELPLTVADFFQLRGVTETAATERLELVGLTDPDFTTRPLGLLSSGQFQRVLVSWALINDPDILLFDEPTAGVDIGGEDTIHNLLQDIRQRRPLAMILVTHDLSTVYGEATNVLCINRKATCYGTPETVLDPDTLKRIYGTDAKFYRHTHE